MKTLTICGVLAEHLGGEPADAALLGGRGQVLEQDRAEPAALLGVLDDERDLGRVGVAGQVPVVGAGRDDLAAQHGDQADRVVRGRPR